MSYDYSTEISLSKELLEEFGRSVKIQKKSTTLEDEDKPYLGSKDTYTDYSVTAVISPIDSGNINSDTVLATDEMAYVAASSITITPEVGDLLVDSSSTYNVVHVNDVSPGDEKILYILTLRR